MTSPIGNVGSTRATEQIDLSQPEVQQGTGASSTAKNTASEFGQSFGDSFSNVASFFGGTNATQSTGGGFDFGGVLDQASKITGGANGLSKLPNPADLLGGIMGGKDGGGLGGIFGSLFGGILGGGSAEKGGAGGMLGIGQGLLGGIQNMVGGLLGGVMDMVGGLLNNVLGGVMGMFGGGQGNGAHASGVLDTVTQNLGSPAKKAEVEPDVDESSSEPV